MKLRSIVLWGVALVALGWVNTSIFQYERWIAQGETIFLEIGPRDPRSLIQGDYMAMRYRIADEIQVDQDSAQDGYLVVRLDDQQIAHLVRMHDDQTPLAPAERLIHFRKRNWDIRVGADSFFFQEGQAELYEAARYAELRLAPSGETILVDLRGPALEQLGPEAP